MMDVSMCVDICQLYDTAVNDASGITISSPSIKDASGNITIPSFSTGLSNTAISKSMAIDSEINEAVLKKLKLNP